MATSALAPPQLVEVPLSLFGGNKTDIAPADCPEGISPDNQDGIFLPGVWSSRPGLQRLFENQLSPGTSILYAKTYVQPNNNPLTLVLTSDGKLWVEDVVNSPYIASQIGLTTPGLYAQSCSAFGREYMAFSDLLHGQGVPLQYEGGTTFDRVTQDGPGAPPIVTDLAPVNYAIGGSPDLAITNATWAIVGASQSGNAVTYKLAVSVDETIQEGDTFVVTGNSVAGYNGVFVVDYAAGDIVECFNSTTGLAPSTGGDLFIYLINVTTVTPAPFQTGTAVAIAGATNAGYDAQYTVRKVFNAQQYAVGPVANNSLPNSGGGTIAEIGLISPGTHQFVLMFLNRNGALTAPSPSSYWTAAGGNLATFRNLAIGPANVVARVIGLTGTGGGDYFSILANATLPNVPGPPIIIQATVIPDNTSTSFVVNFSDNALFASVPIDVIGNDLFDQVVLGPVLGFFSYASRLATWGDYNKVENFLNMGFCGGYLSGVLTTPLGWTVSSAGGTLVNGGSWAAGMAWQIMGDGTNTAKGLIQQTAYQDSFGDAIIQPNTLYGVRLWAKATAAAIASSAVITVALANIGPAVNIPVANLTLAGGFIPLTLFAGNTSIAILKTALLQLSASSLPNGSTVQISELQIVYGVNPYRNNLSRWSYVDNPEGFAQTTGNLGPADDEAPLQCFSLLRKSSLLGTLEGMHIFQDNNFEPDQWVVDSLSRNVGPISLFAMDAGKFGTGDAAEDWIIVASKNGAYMFAGGQFWKVSQEQSRGNLPYSADPRPTWDDTNWAVQQTVWAKNDPAARRAYFGLPIATATTPQLILVMDYREMDTAQQIAAATPIHITIQGKMKSSDLTRKWSRWNIAANSMQILYRPNNGREMIVAGSGFSNLYSLNPAYLTDDDYGQIFPYYTTYAFVDHDQEQQLRLGSGRHLIKKLASFSTGVGLISIVPIVNSLYNFLPATSPRILSPDGNAANALNSDLEWTVNIRGQRVFFRIQVQPLPGTTDVQLRLEKLVAWMMSDPVATLRSSMV